MRVERRAAGLRVVLRGLAAAFAGALRVAVPLDFAAVVLLVFAVLRRAVDRFAAGFAAELREEVEPRDDAELRDELELLREPDESLPSIGHLPDITFCAASATASAISEPRRVALDIIDFAALSAVSAASIPASLIALRAFGLAAIAAAAAVRPAASISLLIAALVILSIVSLDFEVFEEDVFEEEVRLLDLAIADLRLEFAL